tara:strand:- start:228 stop:560 length:333 start_codon:yes stop_codon:yes gene_type:complete
LKVFDIIKIFLTTILFISCNNTSTNYLASEVKKSIIEEWNIAIRDNGESGVKTFDINDFGLVHQEKTYYKGLISGVFYYLDGTNEKFNLTVDVTYDGQMFIWEIPDFYWY